MAQSLSNFTHSLPLSYGSGRSRKQPIGANLNRNSSFSVKAMAGEARENLDHLQRTSKPKKRTAPVTPIGLWDRFPTARTVQQMMDTMDSLTYDPYEWPSSRAAAAEAAAQSQRGGYSRGRTPWEIKERETEYKLRFDMPGMTKEDVKVWVEEKMLVVKAEKSAKKKSGQENGAVGEAAAEEEEWSAKSYGKYSYRIGLPENVEFEKIRAEVRDGVLYIGIPKASGLGKVLDINVE